MFEYCPWIEFSHCGVYFLTATVLQGHNNNGNKDTKMLVIKC